MSGLESYSSRVRNTHCFYRGPECGSQHPDGSQLPATPVSEDLTLSSGSHGHLQSHVRACARAHTHTIKNKIHLTKKEVASHGAWGDDSVRKMLVLQITRVPVPRALITAGRHGGCLCSRGTDMASLEQAGWLD